MSKAYRIGKRESAAFAVTALVAILLTASAFIMAHQPEVVEVRMQLNVADYTGFNLDTDALYFGAISPGGSGTRDLNMVNDRSGPRKVSVFLEGELAGWVQPSEGSFVIDGGGSKAVTFKVSVPPSAVTGEYSGTIRLVFTDIS